MRSVSLSAFVLALSLAGLAQLACAAVEHDTGDTNGTAATSCAFEDVTFDPRGGDVLQAANAHACVVLERAPLDAPVRRGTEWRGVSLEIGVDDAVRAYDAAELAYENSHHNCRDVLVARDGVRVTIDGVLLDDPDLCFAGEPTAWRIVLALPSGNEVLLPR